MPSIGLKVGGVSVRLGVKCLLWLRVERLLDSGICGLRFRGCFSGP